MVNMPKLSIIIPVYNVAKYIEKCGCSLMEQTLDDIEYIFVNDCTPDNSIEILEQTIERYPHRKNSIKIIHHSHNKGLTTTRNSGLAVATGEYIAHCDSDDWVDATMYESLYLKAKENNAEIAYSNIRMIYKDNEEVYKTAVYSEEKGQMMKNYISSVWTCLVYMIAKRELYVNHNLKSPTHLSYCEDFWLSVRLMHYAKRIAYVDDAFYNYNRINENSIVHKLNKRTEKEEQTAYLETIEFFRREGVLEEYERELSWRVLKGKQELILDSCSHNEFLQMFPTSHKYIMSCPYINNKLKIMMWLLSHKLGFVLNGILKLRNGLGR